MTVKRSGGWLRILQVIPYLDPRMGGVVGVCNNLSKSLASFGHQVTIVTTDHGLDSGFAEGLRKVGVEVIPFKCLLDLESYLISPSMKAWASRQIGDYDIAHLHNFRSYQNRLVASVAMKQGTPYVVHAHGDVPIVAKKKLLKKSFDFFYGNRILRGATALIAIAQEEVEHFTEARADPLKVKVLHNGVDPEEYVGIGNGREFRDTFKIEEPYFLFLGRIDETKGLEFLIESFARFLDNGNHGTTLLIIGPKGDSWHKMMQLVHDLELNDSIRWIDFIEKRIKMEAFAGAEAFLSTPNFRSGILLTSLEALMCGTPIIVTDEVGEIPRLAGIDECVTRYGDIEGLAQLMERMLSDGEFSRRIVSKGQKYIMDNLKWTDVTGRLVDIYESCVHNK